MPIDIERFETAAAIREQPTSARILRFLIDHDDSAYTRGEIADAIDTNPETVGTNLTRLKDRGLVRHREPYWAVADERGPVLTALGDYDADPIEATRSDIATRRDQADPTATAEFEPQHAPRDIQGSSAADTRADSSSTAATTSRHRAAASTFFERVRDRLDTAIDALYLFGSVAQGSATAASDVDVLAVIADGADYAAADDQLLDIAYDIQLEFGVRIEIHSIRASEFAARTERGDPFISTVVAEGTDSV